MSDEETPSKNRWSLYDVQKIGVIGVLIYIVQFLFDNINTDNQRFEQKISELLIEQSSIKTKVEMISEKLVVIEEKLEN